jgi:hypothetical protein
VSEKTLNARRTRFKALAEAWAKEAEEELQLEESDIDLMVETVRGALDRQLGRKLQST